MVAPCTPGMVAITRFEDIDAWKAAQRMSDAFDSRAASIKSGRLRKQMEDCCDSAMANIVEGFESRTDAEFLRFLKIAYRSASEFQSHLYVAKNRRFLSSEDFDALYGLAKETKALIGGFMRYLKGCLKGVRIRRR
jgi:four helix bundle protein